MGSSWFELEGDGPEEGSEFPGDGDDGDGWFFAACDHGTVSATKAALSFPSDIADGFWQGLDLAEFPGTEAGWMDVGPSAFDEASSGTVIAGLGDTVAVDVVAGRSFGGREAEISHELARVLKAPRIADLDQERRGGDEADATHGLEGFDQRCHGPVGNFELDRMLQALDALIGIAHGVDALL